MKTAITWLLLGVSLFSTAIQASTDSPETGVFLFRSDDGSWQPALLLNTDMQVQISGRSLKCRFVSPSATPAAPLPRAAMCCRPARARPYMA
ncbi:hypothetical protein ULF88_14165 [Halopseudomonas pachastrellae]|nr:hypothetical protein [Halopseudomonas pachastrellae]